MRSPENVLMNVRPGRRPPLGQSVSCVPVSSLRPLKEALEEPERHIILQALRLLDWNRKQTAEALGIDRSTLWKKMAKYRLLTDPERMVS